MFGKKKAADSTVASGTPEGLTATGVYVNMVEGLRQQARDLRRNNTLLLGICLILAVALLLVLPLRKRIPYFYEVDSATGLGPEHCLLSAALGGAGVRYQWRNSARGITQRLPLDSWFGQHGSG
jgi:hypothetical protein